MNAVLRPRHRRWRLAGLALVAIAWVAAAAGPVAAHENEVIKYGSFLGGLTHPVLGPDHLLAMLSVGILSTQIGGRAILTVPATFVTFMAVGGAVGILYGDIPMEIIEVGIAASVLVLGGAIAAGRRLPIVVAMVAVAIFGSMHGYAHGVETPTIAQPAVYAIGFLLGTATIHLLGVLIGEVALQYQSGTRVLRVGGAAIAMMGSLFLIGVL